MVENRGASRAQDHKGVVTPLQGSRDPLIRESRPLYFKYKKRLGSSQGAGRGGGAAVEHRGSSRAQGPRRRYILIITSKEIFVLVRY